MGLTHATFGQQRVETTATLVTAGLAATGSSPLTVYHSEVRFWSVKHDLEEIDAAPLQVVVFSVSGARRS